jgi:putative flippase GtrA
VKSSLRTLLQRSGVRYVLVGGGVYLLELLIIIVAQRLGASAVYAVIISFIAGTAVSFLLQKLVTFGDKRMQHRVVISQLIATTLLLCWNLGFTILVTKLFVHVWPAVVSRTIALAITVIWNFYLYKTKIFKSIVIVD